MEFEDDDDRLLRESTQQRIETVSLELAAHGHELEKPHACAYCGINAANCVVKCNTCNKWFCNSSTENKGSHIVSHLILSRHRVVSLHEDSDLGDTVLECYNCGNRNVFILGFVSAKQESVVMILCRLPCAQQKDINWDTNQWQPLIEERQFLSWIAGNPSEHEIMEATPVTHSQITKLEAQWRLNREATVEDLEQNGEQEEEVLPIFMRYNDGFQYQRAFAPLLHLESEFDKSMKESQALEHISVRWGLGANKRHLASFILSTFETSALKVAMGDEMILHYNGGEGEPWQASGYIVRLPNAYQDEFTLELDPQKTGPPTQLSTNFTAEFVWKGTPYLRMQNALKTFATDEKSVSAYIYHRILGHNVEPVEFSSPLPDNLTVPKLTKLNESQANAVRTVLQRPLSLIQGPPGTGKTFTSATIIYHLRNMINNRTKSDRKKEKKRPKKILVCAPSNVAVDHLADKISNLGVKVVRLTARSREDVESLVSQLSLHNLILKSSKRLQKLQEKRNAGSEFLANEAKEFNKLLRESEKSILENSEVICCTCVGAGDRRLDSMVFRAVLIDESTQASEPEIMIPIVKGAKQVILVGDHQQLGPVMLHKKAGDAGLKQSLFERLVVLGHVPIRLEVQYRMHPCLSEFPSNMFYEGSLQNGVSSESRTYENETFPWPVFDFPMMFWANYGREEISASGYSYLNRVEAMNVEKAITKLFRQGVTAEQIGVITPYEGQRAYVLQHMLLNGTLVDKREQYAEVEVASVDAFQGREKDYIILSCVRANDDHGIGFLSDPRRLNVALTRAKYGLVIVGNPRCLCKNKLWNHLLIHFREKGCLVEGPLDNLQLSMVQLKQSATTIRPLQPKNYVDDFDTASVVSYIPAPKQDTVQEEAQWPRLGKQINGEENVYGTVPHTLSTNHYDRIQDQPSAYDSQHEGALEKDLKSLTSVFAAGFALD